MASFPREVEQLFQQALAQHRAGHAGIAESHYRRVVKLAPRHAEAWHLLGVLALQQQRAALAVKHLRAAIKVRPDFAQAWNNLALALRAHGDLVGAIAAVEQALALRGDYFEARFNLGLLHAANSNPDAAEVAYAEALRLKPDDVGALTNLGNLLRARTRVDEAAPLLERAYALRTDADSLTNLAVLRVDQGRYVDARALAQQAIATQTANAHAWQTLGVAARLEHDADAAVVALREALHHAPDDVTSQIELALALADAGAHEESQQRLGALARRWPVSTRLRWLAALALPAVAADEDAALRARVEFETGLALIERDTLLETPAQIAAAFEAASSVVPFHLHYQARDNSHLQRRFGALVSRCVAAAAPDLAEPCDWVARTHDGRVRVGFVSSHLYAHSVPRFFGSLVTGLDRIRCETFVWHTGETADATTASVANAVDHFRHHFAPPLEVARAIRAARLDVLVLLDVGMDPAMQVLGSLRLAPVQCAAYGHPVTTGLAQVDYFLSGELLESPDGERDYSEVLVRLPGIGVCPEQPLTGGDGAWLHSVADDLPWLLCLQNPLKMSPDFDDLLVEILASHRARIGVFSVAPSIAARWRERIGTKLDTRGGDISARLHLLPPVTHADLVAGIARATLVLDTSHFSGGSTSLDAIAAATPIVSFKGNRLRANQTAAMLQIVGAPELIANDATEYQGIVRHLLTDADERQRLSDALRDGAPRLFDDRAPIVALQTFLEQAVPDLGYSLLPSREGGA
ncbi:MAG: tetratricopeptide repeat protein [Lysobacterales bacterium]